MKSFEEFLKKESSSGILLILATLAALICKNTGLKDMYDSFLTTPVVVQVGALAIDKDLHLWINDGLMII